MHFFTFSTVGFGLRQRPLHNICIGGIWHQWINRQLYIWIFARLLWTKAVILCIFNVGNCCMCFECFHVGFQIVADFAICRWLNGARDFGQPLCTGYVSIISLNRCIVRAFFMNISFNLTIYVVIFRSEISTEN